MFHQSTHNNSQDTSEFAATTAATSTVEVLRYHAAYQYRDQTLTLIRDWQDREREPRSARATMSELMRGVSGTELR